MFFFLDKKERPEGMPTAKKSRLKILSTQKLRQKTSCAIQAGKAGERISFIAEQTTLPCLPDRS
jgi:hypothetical protein